MIVIDRRTRVSLQRQVYLGIRDAILSGRLASATRLPPSRELAGDLGVSRTTVVFAYEQLTTEGYLQTRGSAGSFVADLRIGRPTMRPMRVAAEPTRDARGQAVLATARVARGWPTVRAAPVPFRIGVPALDLFPVRLWARLFARRARRSGASLLGYGDAGGFAPLRAAIAAYVRTARGVNATAEQVILTRGTQQAIDLATRVLVSPGDVVWVEDPGYLAAHALFRSAGASIVGVPVDDAGLDVDQSIAHAPQACIIYVAPSHQFPLGTSMTLARRLALLEWAGRSRAWILEDDYDSEFRHAGAPTPSLQGLDRHDRVVYLGTFSKTMFPALRLGYLVLPPGLVDAFRAMQSTIDSLSPSIEQATLTEFIEAGHFARHVRRMRAVYAARQRALVRAAHRELGDLVHARPAHTGMHIIAWLTNQSIDDARVARLAWNAGVEASPLSLYRIKATLPPALLLGFASTRPVEMGPALRVVRQAIFDAM